MIVCTSFLRRILFNAVQPGGFQNTCIKTEDAAALGRFFAYLSDEDQIRDFLLGFESLRQARSAKIAEGEYQNFLYMILPDGEEQRTRDDTLKNNSAAGEYILQGITNNVTDWSIAGHVYIHDPEDGVDDWWLKWGALKARAKEMLNEPPAEEMQELDLVD
jgi:salicylate hydroxylase